MTKIKFNTKHLQKGDPLPPFNGKLRIYNMRYCPYAQRTILALNAKQLDYEVVNINLQDKPEWLPTKSAFGKVPALEIEDGVSIYESLITVEYLDEVFPQRPLLPKDPVKKAFDKILVEAFGPIQVYFYKALLDPSSITPESKATFEKTLAFFEDSLQQRGGKFFGGSEPGYVDYMIWPWFERIATLDGLDGLVKIDSEKYKLLTEYIAAMFEDPAVKPYVVPRDILTKFFDNYVKKLPKQYDFLDDQD